MDFFDKNSRNRLKKGAIPNHVAVIMDGNGRWAKKRGLPRTMGHSKGLESLKKIIEESGELGIKVLTAYAFSTENWKRPKREVNFLLKLFEESLIKDSMKIKENLVSVRFLGDLSAFPARLQELMQKSEKMVSKKNAQIRLNLLVNYGGRAEILQAVNKAIRQKKQIKTETQFSKLLYTNDIQDPELMIRTSGEQRISNYLLWQLSYSEFYFTKILWPDFSPKQYRKAIKAYQSRKIRRGGL